MVRLILFTLACAYGSTSFAGTLDCSELATRADRLENGYRPPLEAAVVGNGKLDVYTAPDRRCPMRGVFAVDGDVLTVYGSFHGWENVMYIAKSGDDFTGWVREDRTKPIGQYGNNP